jgi:hypothetical protein
MTSMMALRMAMYVPVPSGPGVFVRLPPISPPAKGIALSRVAGLWGVHEHPMAGFLLLARGF